VFALEFKVPQRKHIRIRTIQFVRKGFTKIDLQPCKNYLDQLSKILMTNYGIKKPATTQL
jgi:hypothetical protein